MSLLIWALMQLHATPSPPTTQCQTKRPPHKWRGLPLTFRLTLRKQSPTIARSAGAVGWLAPPQVLRRTRSLLRIEAPAHGTAGQSDQELSAKHALAVEGLDVAPFDLTQLEVDEEPPTGYLDAQEMKSKYGTANLDMADDAAHAHDAGSGDTNWSSENDTSYFASSTPTEVELAQAGNTFFLYLASDLGPGGRSKSRALTTWTKKQ